MAYEVIKQRGKRAYRYTVEYYHDEHGKGRTRWQYQGPVDGATAAGMSANPRPPERLSTASRLLDALERLLARGEYAEITASAVALEANVAHGTFYRHFKDKRDALRAAMQRLAERAEHLAHLDAATPDLTRERRRVRDWLRQKLTTVGEQPGVWRAWSALSESDASIAALRQNLRAASCKMVGLYLASVHAAGHTDLERGEDVARTIMALLFGVLQASFTTNGGPPHPEMVEHACLMVDRMIFATGLPALIIEGQAPVSDDHSQPGGLGQTETV